MQVVNIREFRNQLAASFDYVDAGEQLLIRRKHRMYTLVPIEENEIQMSAGVEEKADSWKERLLASFRQVEEHIAGKVELQTAEEFLYELENIPD